MARGSPYSTHLWQKTRRYILARDPYCTIQGPRCTKISTVAHHVVPSSQDPSRFFDVDNLRGACRTCNAAEGAQIASVNQATRATVARLERVIQQQAEQIDMLLHRLEEHERPRPRPTPAIR